MKPLFSPTANLIARGALLGAILGIPLVLWQVYFFANSRYATSVGFAHPQPVPFSHQHHVADEGIDCRYCHGSVEESSFAGMPSTETCMSCHSQLWTNAELLAPVRESWQTNTPLRWRRVHDMPDYVYFNHAIHVQNGVGCAECHGRVDQMPLMKRAAPLTMRWCLDCHRDPAKNLRPRDQITSMTWKPPNDGGEQGRRLLEEYQIPTHRILDCTTCHR